MIRVVPGSRLMASWRQLAGSVASRRARGLTVSPASVCSASRRSAGAACLAVSPARMSVRIRFPSRSLRARYQLEVGAQGRNGTAHACGSVRHRVSSEGSALGAGRGPGRFRLGCTRSLAPASSRRRARTSFHGSIPFQRSCSCVPVGDSAELRGELPVVVAPRHLELALDVGQHDSAPRGARSAGCACRCPRPAWYRRPAQRPVQVQRPPRVRLDGHASPEAVGRAGGQQSTRSMLSATPSPCPKTAMRHRRRPDRRPGRPRRSGAPAPRTGGPSPARCGLRRSLRIRSSSPWSKLFRVSGGVAARPARPAFTPRFSAGASPAAVRTGALVGVPGSAAGSADRPVAAPAVSIRPTALSMERTVPVSESPAMFAQNPTAMAASSAFVVLSVTRSPPAWAGSGTRRGGRFAFDADDCQRARRFYEDVFGWTFEPWGPPDSWRVHTSPGGIHGALQSGAHPLRGPGSRLSSARSRWKTWRQPPRPSKPTAASSPCSRSRSSTRGLS